jgi:hypothetical protein
VAGGNVGAAGGGGATGVSVGRTVGRIRTSMGIGVFVGPSVLKGGAVGIRVTVGGGVGVTVGFGVHVGGKVATAAACTVGLTSGGGNGLIAICGFMKIAMYANRTRAVRLPTTTMPMVSISSVIWSNMIRPPQQET